MTLKIGFHPNNLHLTLASHWPGAFKTLRPDFIRYEEGRDTAVKLARGEIDLGGTGSTPPIIAAVNGMSVIYAAASAPRPANGAILVKKGAGVERIADLSNKPVALVDGSFLTYFLARSLEEAGLNLGNVERRDLPPAQSRELLLSGEVAAWLAMAPHLEQALGEGDFQVLAHCGTTIPNRSLFWTSKERALSAETLATFQSELAELGQAITADPEQAARLLSPDGGERERRAWTRIVSERNWRIDPADAELLWEQQREADTLFRHGALERSVQIAEQNGKAALS
ncbi:ABC transporter substrate-binding protein [Tianweitania populi]|uniref:ABC transporter substrate-binding protein n=1 Tax=Tianweitania populi TaxID=1607949 RepID=UPI0027E4AA72|nr:ABC transporter substrate-binding protein [Tianweitania populi]